MPSPISLTGKRNIKEIPSQNRDLHFPVKEQQKYVLDESTSSILQPTGKHHLKSVTHPVSGSQQDDPETTTDIEDDVTSSEAYTKPYDVYVTYTSDTAELKRRSIRSEEPPASNLSKERIVLNNAASTPSETSSQEDPQLQNKIPSLSKQPAFGLQRNSAVPLNGHIPPKWNSAVPRDRPSSSPKIRIVSPAQQDSTSQQNPLTAQRPDTPNPLEPGYRTEWTVANPPPGKAGMKMQLSHYPMKKIQLFGRRHNHSVRRDEDEMEHLKVKVK
jgi:hypothetical protein